ncbi:hypothetical protein [Bacillus sp. SA1-12]|uniref:hypothetical protein n=1 Tax=Bacillus sp. SA1-12 TaxID=1455638 RepID=UPI000B044074|nr:hypothetical protein [Bacillus sp. SA1-12]
MWIITVHLTNNIKMFEFDNVKEAKEAYERIQGYKILTEVIYYNNYSLVESQSL